MCWAAKSRLWPKIRVTGGSAEAKNSFSCIKMGCRLWLLWLQMQKFRKKGCNEKDVILGRPRNFDVCRAPIKIHAPAIRKKAQMRATPPPFRAPPPFSAEVPFWGGPGGTFGLDFNPDPPLALFLPRSGGFARKMGINFCW